MRNRAELFGREAVLLLQELNCAESVDLQIVDPESSSRPESVALNGSSVTHLQTDISIVPGSSAHKRVTLSFVPLGYPKSQLIALSFKRVISQILASRTTDTTFGDHDIVWTSSNSTATEQGVVFASESMLSVLRTVRQIAPTDISVLITGETGTGKEVIARIVHEQSRRSVMPFIALNCAAVPKDLLESQLFGHRKGASQALQTRIKELSEQRTEELYFSTK